MVNLKILIFFVYFFNIDISLIITLICLKMCMFIAEICMEGSVPQNFDLGHSFETRFTRYKCFLYMFKVLYMQVIYQG